MPSQRSNPADNAEVKTAYERMTRVLGELAVSPDGAILVGGAPIETRLSDYYRPYVRIERYIKDNPGNINGAYEVIWDNGGEGRVHIGDTQNFETVVRAFFVEYSRAKNKRRPESKP
jgi:hypothetical protein